MIIINALTVSVGYADLLEQTMPRWSAGLHSLTVVTADHDRETPTLVRQHPPLCRWQLFESNAFYQHGAFFDKGGAMEQARRFMPWHGWILFFDPDGLPPAGWADMLGKLDPACLYGAKRDTASSPCMGYFQLFHSSRFDAAAPLLTRWKTASGYDNDFAARFEPEQRCTLPLTLRHLEPSGHWCGRGNAEAMESVMAERKRLGGFAHERLG